jgi:hypothetical protein
MVLLDRGGRIQVDRTDWGLACAGVVFILYTFTADITGILVREGVEAVMAFVPTSYNWAVFLVGYGLMVGATVRIGCRSGRAAPAG